MTCVFSFGVLECFLVAEKGRRRKGREAGFLRLFYPNARSVIAYRVFLQRSAKIYPFLFLTFLHLIKIVLILVYLGWIKYCCISDFCNVCSFARLSFVVDFNFSASLAKTENSSCSSMGGYGNGYFFNIGISIPL